MAKNLTREEMQMLGFGTASNGVRNNVVSRNENVVHASVPKMEYHYKPEVVDEEKIKRMEERWLGKFVVVSHGNRILYGVIDKVHSVMSGKLGFAWSYGDEWGASLIDEREILHKAETPIDVKKARVNARAYFMNEIETLSRFKDQSKVQARREYLQGWLDKITW